MTFAEVFGYEATVDTVVSGRVIKRITRNDAYDDIANAVLSLTVTKNFYSWAGTLTIRHRVSNVVLLTKSVTVASSTLLTCSLSSTDTAFTLLTSNEDFGAHPFDIEMESGASKQTPIRGVAIINRDQTTT